MCLFKKELLVTSSMEQKSKALDILSRNKIKYYLKTKDNFDGGFSSGRRDLGSFGMDASVRYTYYIYVSKKDYGEAEFLLK